MMNHSNCDHDATKAARARCRRNRTAPAQWDYSNDHRPTPPRRKGLTPTPAPREVARRRTDFDEVDRNICSLVEELEGTGYTPNTLAQTRQVQIMNDLDAGRKIITVKVPSHSEVRMTRDTARFLLSGSHMR